MAFPATNLRFSNRTLTLFAKSTHLHPLLKERCERTGHCGAELQVWAGIGQQDRRQRTGFAQSRRPALSRDFKQTALFDISAAVIIAVEKFTLSARRCSHGIRRELHIRRCGYLRESHHPL